MKILLALGLVVVAMAAGAAALYGSTPVTPPPAVDEVEITTEQQALKCELLDTENVPNAVRAALDNWGTGC